jgi:undecaprenyl-diphosphatase
MRPAEGVRAVRRDPGPPVSALIVTFLVATAAFVWLLMVAGLRVSATPGWDLAIRRWVLAHRSRALTDAAVSLSLTGPSAICMLLVAATGMLVTTGTLARRVRVAAGYTAAIAIPVAVRLTIAETVARNRPPHADWLREASGFAFPSGHATAAAIAAALLTQLAAQRVRTDSARRAVGAVAVIWAVGVGWSRVYLGVHWPTDVLAGWALAIAWLTLMRLLELRRTSQEPAPEVGGLQGVKGWLRRGCRGAG